MRRLHRGSWHEDKIDLLELAQVLAEIASKTAEPQTAEQLVALIDQLLTDAGLPDESKQQSRH